MRAHRKFTFGNLRPALASNSEETEFLETIGHIRRGESIGFLIDLHDINNTNIRYTAKFARAHEETVEINPLFGLFDI